MSEQEPMHGERRWRHCDGAVCPHVEIYIADGANSRWATPEAYWQAQAAPQKPLPLTPELPTLAETYRRTYAQEYAQAYIAKQSEQPEPYVAAQLKQKADLYKQRTALYSREGEPPGYMKRGPLLQLLLGDVQLNTPHDHARYAQFVWLAEKLHRYATNFTKGGHADSLDDISVIAMMLKELDENGPAT